LTGLLPARLRCTNRSVSHVPRYASSVSLHAPYQSTNSLRQKPPINTEGTAANS